MGQIDPALFQTVTGIRMAFLAIENSSHAFHGIQVEAVFVHSWLTHVDPFVLPLMERGEPVVAHFRDSAGAR
ncbi:hypothetical protein [Streptomyces sp. NPDC091217]|uniref:hypothetical protein n=1 Tax=Streptomyces sp. NPDC091217 TaxID=3365975 RepID=UPI0037F1298F